MLPKYGLPLPARPLSPHSAPGAALVGQRIGIDVSAIQKSINEFKGLPHRLEKVAEIDGIEFINDSIL